MTITTDRADSGEIPALPGETARLITADERERLIGEQTENLSQYARPDAPFMTTVRSAAGDRAERETTEYPTIGVLPDLGSDRPTLVFGERVIDIEDTVVHGILDSLAGVSATVDGELEGPQSPPPPLPPIPVPGKGRSVPMAAMVNRAPASLPARLRYRGSRRRSVERRVSPWWGVAVAVLFGLAAYAGLALAALAVIR